MLLVASDGKGVERGVTFQSRFLFLPSVELYKGFCEEMVANYEGPLKEVGALAKLVSQMVPFCICA